MKFVPLAHASKTMTKELLLLNQQLIRINAVSIPSNISEGEARQSTKDFLIPGRYARKKSNNI